MPTASGSDGQITRSVTKSQQKESKPKHKNQPVSQQKSSPKGKRKQQPSSPENSKKAAKKTHYADRNQDYQDSIIIIFLNLNQILVVSFL